MIPPPVLVALLAAATRSRCPPCPQCGQQNTLLVGLGTRREHLGQVEEVPRSSATERAGAGQPARLPGGERRSRNLRVQGRGARDPDWYHNLLAKPRASAEIGKGTVDVTARVADPEERERIWSRQKEAARQFADYERQAAPGRSPSSSSSPLAPIRF